MNNIEQEAKFKLVNVFKTFGKKCFVSHITIIFGPYLHVYTFIYVYMKFEKN